MTPPSQHSTVPPPSTSPGPATRGEGPPPAGPAVGCRVLLVDDNCTLTELLARAMQAKGSVVLQVNDPADALSAAREFQPHVVVLDILMPGINGAEIAWRLAQDHSLRNTPRIILCTGLAWGAFPQELPPVRVSFLEKPVVIEDLLAEIERVQIARTVGCF